MWCESSGHSSSCSPRTVSWHNTVRPWLAAQRQRKGRAPARSSTSFVQRESRVRHDTDGSSRQPSRLKGPPQIGGVFPAAYTCPKPEPTDSAIKVRWIDRSTDERAQVGLRQTSLVLNENAQITARIWRKRRISPGGQILRRCRTTTRSPARFLSTQRPKGMSSQNKRVLTLGANRPGDTCGPTAGHIVGEHQHSHATRSYKTMQRTRCSSSVARASNAAHKTQYVDVGCEVQLEQRGAAS